MPSGAIDRVFGIAHFDGRRLSAARLGAMAAALSMPVAPTEVRARRVEQRIHESVGMGCLRVGDSTSPPPQPFVHRDSGIVVTADARLYDRGALVQSLRCTESDALSDNQLLAEAYLRWGLSFATYVRGDFAVAIWEPRQRSFVFARDHIGCAPLFYAPLRAGVAFASDINGVVAALPHVPDLDQDWIPSLLTKDQSDPDRTPYAEVRRVWPGHVLRVDASGERRQRYWDLDSSRTIVLSSDNEYEEALRSRLENAVSVRLPAGAATVGSELSGGLDSSTVAALASTLARARGAPFMTLSHVPPDDRPGHFQPQPDEREWADQLRRHAGIESHVPVSAGGYSALDSLERGIRIHGAPTVGGFAVFPDALYDSAREHGVGTLFSGFGGDQMVSGAALLPGASPRLMLRGWWQRRSALPESRTLAHADARSRDILKRLPVTAEYAERWSLYERAMAEWRVLADVRKACDVRAYERYRVVTQAATAERLESGNVAAGACAVGYRYPLLDVPLLEFFHALPSEQKRRDDWGRYLFRRSIRDWVPESVRWRPNKQGATVPNCLARFRGTQAAVHHVLASARSRPELEFLDADRLSRWAEEILASARGEGAKGAVALRFGRFVSVLALALYYDMREQGWRPGQPVP